jgi:hypothetical protein
MTARRLGMAALSAAVVVAVGIVASPLLPDSGHAERPASRPMVDVPAHVVRIATSAARIAVGCPRTASPSRAAIPAYRQCGELRVSEGSATCSSPSRCQVELVGTIATAPAPVPVALTVTIDRIGSRWRALEVRS